MSEARQDEREAALAWDQADAVDRLVAAGDWSLRLRRAELAEVRFRGRRVLRGIRFIVRDRDWRTAQERAVELTDDGDGRLTLAAVAAFDGQDAVSWRLAVEISAGRLTVAAEATILRDFARNRVGLVVLHGPELAGAPLEVVHVDGTTTSTAFPLGISPHQPALDVRGYRWTSDGVAAELELDGEVFEMEDQRNWTDASYKTYSTRLAEPFPVELAAGTRIAQSLRLGCTATGAAPAPPPPLRLTPSAERLPRLQLTSSLDPAVRPTPIEPPLGLLVELDAAGDWAGALERARTEAGGRPLDVRVLASSPAALAEVVAALAPGQVARLGAFDPDSHLTEPPQRAALAAARERLGGGVELTGGTRAHFTELNRGIGRLDGWEGALAFSVTPQMHDRSREQLMESLGIQRLVAEQAVRLAGDRPVDVGPVTLRPRFNAVATSPGAGRRLPDPAAVDPRSASRAAAAWTLGAVAALSVPGVRSLTLGETAGARGVLAGAAGAPLPSGRVARWLAAGGELVELAPEPGEADAVAWIAQRAGDAAVQLLVAELAGATARLGAPCGLRIVRAEGASGETLEHTGQLVVLRPLQAARLLLAPL
jgi:hypothetical protein